MYRSFTPNQSALALCSSPQLCQVELEADEPKVAKHMISDRLTLVSLQNLLLEEYGELSNINYVTVEQTLSPSICTVLGEEHFNASQNPYLYFQVLVLTQQFEPVSVHSVLQVLLDVLLRSIVPVLSIGY